MKKILITLLVIVIAAGCAIGVVGAVSFSSGDLLSDDGSVYDTTTEVGDNLSHNFIAEITYNDLRLQNGAILKSMQYWVDIETLTINKSDAAKLAINKEITAALTKIAESYKKSGYKTTIDNGLLEVTMQYFESYTDMYIYYGITGYDTSPDTTVKEGGAFFNKTYAKNTTIFANMKGSVVENAAQILASVDGISDTNIAYIYNYGTKYGKGLINSDADSIYTFKKLDITIHKFVMNKNNLNKTYTLIQKTPNTVSWYAINLASTIIIAGIFVVIAVIERRKNK